MEEVEHLELLLLTAFLLVAAELLDHIEQEEANALKEHIKEQRRLCRSLPAEKTRPTWTGFCNRVSDSHFHRQFRMTRSAYTNFCSILCTAIGEDTFRPENWSQSARNSASHESRGGLIPGEVKVAIALRILAGASYLDLMPLFDVSVPHIYVVFDEFLDWVLKAFHFPLVQHLQDENWDALRGLAEPFSYGSNGVFSGIIGALDGLAVRIRSPTLKEVPDPGNYYCRKGFFAINVQAICDKSKRFTWVYTSNKGSTHDSVAFSNSRLYLLLLEKSNALQHKGLYLVGDSAYNLTPFILVPYCTDDIRNDRSDVYDTFNFFLSSARINIECAFGELVSRWGILWRTLRFDLGKCQRIVQVCMLVHNFIKDDSDTEDACYNDLNWRPRDGSAVEDFSSAGQERPFPLVTDNNEVAPGGRRSNLQEYQRRRGESIRRSITMELQLHGLCRPLYNGMKYNQYGHVYFDGS
mgnify:CR=1 FL=1